MRYSDGPSVRADIVVRGAIGAVWAVVSDIAVPARFSGEVASVRWLVGNRVVVGARFEGVNSHPVMGQWRTECEVVEVVEPRAFAWEVFDVDGRFGGVVGVPMAAWRFDLDEVDGGVRVALSGRIGPGRSGVSLAVDRSPDREEAIVESRLGELRDGVVATLSGIKGLIEAG